MAEQTQEKREKNPEIIDLIGKNTFDMINVLIFIDHPENKDTQQEKSAKFECFDNTRFQVQKF